MQTIDKVSLSTSVFGADDGQERTLGHFLELAQQAGYTMVELSRRQKKGDVEVIRKSGIKVWSIHGIYGGPLTGSEADIQKGIDAACARVEALAEFAPCPVVEHYLDRFNNPEMGKKFHAVMEYLLEETEKLGFVFCMENAPYKPEHNERFPNVAEVAAFTRSFGKDRMFMTFDLNHANLHEDPVAVCSDCAGLVKHIHISDNHGFREEHLIPGTGTMDLGSIMTALYQNGFDGPWNLEFGFAKDTEPTLEQYQQVYQYMHQYYLNHDIEHNLPR